MDDPTTRNPDPSATASTTPPPPDWARRRSRNDGSRIWTVAVGLFLVGVGLWFFAERTLGLVMPVIRWSQLWPILVIGVGVLILAGAIRRER